MKIPMKRVAADRAHLSDDLVASGHQIEMVFRKGQKALSLRAGKIFHLLVKASGANLADDKNHSMPLSALYELCHLRSEDMVETIRELQSTLVEVTLPSPLIKGGLRTETGALLSRVARDHDAPGVIEWTFSPTMRLIFESTDHWAIISKRAVMAFESRYSLRLYEIISLRVGLEHITSETFDLEDLRRRLGVPDGKLVEWFGFRQRALDPAIVEVNHLTGLHVAYEPIKRSRSVVSVKLSWGQKTAPGRKAAARELTHSKVGRSARRAGTVELVSDNQTPLPAPTGFPASGTIAFGKWAELVRQHAPRPTPDVDLVASAFRKWTGSKSFPLDGAAIEKAFVGFCKGFGK